MNSTAIVVLFMLQYNSMIPLWASNMEVPSKQIFQEPIMGCRIQVRARMQRRVTKM
jgi:hypothetical protein